MTTLQLKIPRDNRYAVVLPMHFLELVTHVHDRIHLSFRGHHIHTVVKVCRRFKSFLLCFFFHFGMHSVVLCADNGARLIQSLRAERHNQLQ